MATLYNYINAFNINWSLAWSIIVADDFFLVLFKPAYELFDRLDYQNQE